jgi:DNA replication protein DnaC
MEKGLDPQFLVADKYTFSTKLELKSGQVWVIDDMNSGFHISSRLFREVVLNAHERGGRVFITSNKNYDELMKECFVGDSKANYIRYVDRTKGMFKILHVHGSSFRQAHAWYI